MTDSQTTVAELKELMSAFVKERNWEKFHQPRNLAASVCVEAGELLEHFQWLTAEEATERAKMDAAFRTAVGEEMADVLMYLLSLSNALGLDFAAAVEGKMVKNKLKYPKEKFWGNYERPLSQ
jgi:NTP pyrophosphatase (non-canonical NTP hydrolase)